MLRFTYRLFRKARPVSLRSKLWDILLPVCLQSVAGKQNRTCADKADKAVSYKFFFQTVQSFLKQNNYQNLMLAAARQLQRPVCSKEFHEVIVTLEKHGRFYHPCYIELIGPVETLAFVLNVAVSDVGQTSIALEYNTIDQLNKSFPEKYLPTVYAFGKGIAPADGKSLPMFLGEWLEGFSEFHLSFDPKTRKNRIKVWDYDQGFFFLSSNQTIDLFRQAAKILTSYLNLDTFEHLISWHHAAGDFVVRLEKGRMKVRLISARRYSKLFRDLEGTEKGMSLLIRGLLIFFLHLSIRIRLDRLDGTGPVVWLEKNALKGAIKGFLEVVTRKTQHAKLPVPIKDAMKAVLGVLTKKGLLELLQEIAATYQPESQDAKTIQTNLDQHAADFYQIIHDQ